MGNVHHLNQGIMPTVTPSWAEFDPATYTANTTYQVTINRALGNFTFSQANVTLIFAGGRFTGSGTITGNYTTFVTEPAQCFDVGIVFAGTWNMEKVYAENFDTISAMSTNAAPAINRALQLSNVSGCVVQLLSKTYTITSSITILGNNTLVGTIAGPSLPGGSAVSKDGTLIYTTSNINVLSIRTTGNTSSDVDCYRFAIRNLAIRHAGSGTTETLGNSIFIEATSTLTPRNGLISNVIIRHTTSDGYSPSANGYAIRVSGGSYIEFHSISIGSGKGVKVTGDKLNEFLYFNKVTIGDVSVTSFEITHGNNLYLTEIDTNDSTTGLLINNSTAETFNVFVNRFNSVRCSYGIHLQTHTNYLTRIKVSEATIFQVSGQAKTPVSGIHFSKGVSNSFIVDNCLFENINVDTNASLMTSTTYRSINDNGNLTNSRFTNIKLNERVTLNSYGNNNELSILNMRRGHFYVPGGTNASSYQISLFANNSPLPGHPVVLVNVFIPNVTTPVPFFVKSNNVAGGSCYFTVYFPSVVASNVEICYSVTGYYYS